MKTQTPSVDRFSLSRLDTPSITGTLSAEIPGTIVYVYLNMRRAGTTIVSNDATRSWTLPITNLSFGGSAARLKAGDRLYVQARSVGKEMSDPSVVYTVFGLDQPSAPYVRDSGTGLSRSVYERDTLIEGDVPLLWDYSVLPPQQVLFTPDLARNVMEGVAVSVYLEKTFLGSVQSDRAGHWQLNLSDPQFVGQPLLPLSKGQILTVRATRYFFPVGSDVPTQLVYPSAESAASPVLSNFFETRLFDYYPAQWKVDDQESGNNDLKNFTKILALTMDETKAYVDSFPEIFDISRCDPKYFGAIAALLGYPLNRLDSNESQRFQLQNVMQFWQKKGTTDIFRILFYLLDYEIEMVELWTENYTLFFPVNAVGYPKSTYPEGPPNDAPELLENGGTWYKSPYFGIVINPLVAYEPTTNPDGTRKVYPYQIDYENCPLETGSVSVSLSLDDLRYLLERIDYFRPAHTVLDYISFRIPLQECGPIPDEKWRLGVHWQPQEPAWHLPYCDPDDPIYYRDGLRSTRPDGKGLDILGVTRDYTSPNASYKLHIKMFRKPERGYCHPGEELMFDLQPTSDEEYYFYMPRSGMGFGMYPIGEPLGDIDMNEWPSRNPLCDPPDRSGRYRYASRLVMRLETYTGIELTTPPVAVTIPGAPINLVEVP